ncbi:MAG: hypothetical protein V4582_17380 [Pseudomonadota bacterium]
MMAAKLSLALLQLQLGVRRRGPVALLAAVLMLAAIAAWAWYLPQAKVQRAATAARAAAPVPGPAPAALTALAPPPTNEHNLAQFYEALGERRYAEQQLKTLFSLASKNGLSLSAGQYKEAYDRNARMHTYQLSLPVKGSYRAIWQFSLGALAEIPFASLDEVSFRREQIADPVADAHVRLTLYLKDGGPQP